MTCTTFLMVDPPMRGTPKPRYFKPLVRTNGMVQDAGFDHKLDPCYLDLPALRAALTVLPPGSPGIAPLLHIDPTIPTSVVGTDNYLLAQPALWANVVVAGITYVMPLYLPGV